MSNLSRKQLGVSLSARSDLPPAEAISLLSGFGAGVLEINEKYLTNYPDAPGEFISKGICVTAHVPHDHKAYHPLSKDQDVRSVSLPNIMQWVEKAHAQGIDYFTVHLMDPCPARLEEFWDEAVATAKQIGDFARDLGVRIGFENCYRMVRDGPVAAKFFDAVNHPSLGLTLDAGHFWSALDLDEYGNLKKEKVLLKKPEGVAEMNRMLHEMVDSLQHRILHMHLHDIWESTWQDHHSVGSGVMDYPDLLDRLVGMGYRGTMVVEIRPGEPEGVAGLRRSLEHLVQTGSFG